VTPEEAAALQQHYAQQQAQPSLEKDIRDIVEIGRTHFSTATFDDQSQTVADVLGDKKNQVLQILAEFDRPHEVIAHLAQNEAQLKKLATLSPARQVIEIGKIEARLSSSVNTGADPLWKTPAVRSGRVSDADWKTSFGEGLDDKRFDKEFWRRQEERGKRRR
jgi:CO/xanthine dehydrogenase Mo-binding subunit